MAITEARNEISRNIGELDGNGIIKIFEMSDTSLFSEISIGQPGLCHQKVLHKIKTLKETILELLHEKEGNTQIIFAGCGTSGRLGFIVSKMFDKFVRLSQSRTSFQNCMAGGSAALILSQEGSEDNPDAGKEDLISVLHGEKAVYVGISCGLSAPYIGGQLMYCLSTENVIPVIIGFNPVDLARSSKLISGECFQTILNHMISKGKENLIINPVIGPEIITGSSRLKGGSVTFIILCSCILAALSETNYHCAIAVEALLTIYQKSIECFYKQCEGLDDLIDICGEKLSKNGRIFYMCFDEDDIMAFFDAAECVPTFGASFNDVRAFVLKDSNLLQDNSMKNKITSTELKISWNHFLLEFRNRLNENDSVIFFKSSIKKPYSGIEQVLVNDVVDAIKVSNASLHMILVGLPLIDFANLKCDLTFSILSDKGKIINNLTDLQLDTYQYHTQPLTSLLQLSVRHLVLKLTVNCISTGSFVKFGKIYGNDMIDIQLSNLKLFERGINILQYITNKPYETCNQTLLNLLYTHGNLQDAICKADMEDVINKAKKFKKIIPTAALMLILNCTVKDAQVKLSRDPNVKRCVELAKNE